jgi:outer membrane protein TolC
MKKQALLFLLIVSGFCVEAQTAPLQTFTVEQAVEFALQNKSEAKNSLLDIQKAKARNWEIISTGLPVVSGSADYTYYFKRPESPAIQKIFSDPESPSNKINYALGNMFPEIGKILVDAQKSAGQPIYFQLPHNLQAGVQVTELFFDGRYVVGLKATKDFMKLARQTKEVSDQEIRYNIRKAYYQAQAGKQAIGLLNETVQIVEKLVTDTRATYKEGLIEELDVNRLELILANLQSQIQTQVQLAEIAQANLKFQMGLSVSDPIVLTDKLETLRETLKPQTPTFNPNQRPEYDLLQTAMRVRGHDTKQRAAGYAPTLAGFLNYGGGSQVDKFGDIFRKDATTGKNNWFQQGLVGLSLKVPIFDSGQRQAQVKQGKIDELKAKNDFESFMKGLELQLMVSQTNYNSSLQEELNTKRTLELSKKIFSTSKIKFKEGVGSSFELVQAEREFVSNQLKYIQSLQSVLAAKADLDKAMGIK